MNRFNTFSYFVKLAAVLVALALPYFTNAHNGTIKGVVTDAETRLGLPGAHVHINTEPTKITFTDELGQPQTVTTSNGLSATVFEDTQTHQRYLAIRGTDDVQDLITDAIDVGFLGTSLFQAQYQSLAQKVADIAHRRRVLVLREG